MFQYLNLHAGKLKTLALLSATFLICLPLVHAQLPEWAPPPVPTKDPVLIWMNNIAQQQLQQREDAIAQIHTVAEADRRKQEVRAKLLKVLGGLPDYHGPLNPRITGRIEGEGYTIENLLYESLPHFYVTANVYRPNQPGRYPAIVIQQGHIQEGKPMHQNLAANLALKGFVVLCFDPIGQGERLQSYDAQVGKSVSILGGSGNDHVQAGAQTYLIGESLARYFIWDAMRALDYLQTRPDVDGKRLGAMGCSGGGATTLLLGALDTRLKAVAPGCFPNTFRTLYAGVDPDPEMAPPRLMVEGLDTADYLEASAPTPWLVMATEGDYFPPPSAQAVTDEAKRFFKIYGAEDHVRLFVGSGYHGTPPETRAAIYEWMIRWLKDGKGDFLEQRVKLYPNHKLQVTRMGQVDGEPGSRKVYQLAQEEYQAKKRPGTIPELQAELRRLQIPTDGSAPPVKVLEETNGVDGKRQRIQFESEPGILISGKLYIPPSPGRKPAVLLVVDEMTSKSISTTDYLAELYAKRGRVVLTMDPRNCPDERPFYRSSVSQDFSDRTLGSWLGDMRADWIGRSMAAMRAHDILRGVDLLVARDDVDPSSIHANARGVNGIQLLLAAAADPRIGKVWLDRTPHNLRSALNNSMADRLFDVLVPGFVLHWDLEDLVKAMGDRPVLQTDPMNWTGQIAPLDEPPYHFRYVLGCDWDLREDMDKPYIAEFLK